MSPKSLAKKTARIGFRVFKPFLIFAKNKYDVYKKLLPDMSYHNFAEQNELLCFVEDKLNDQPLVSVVVPLYNTPINHFLEMVYSVVNQHYQNWELILVNASTEHDLRSFAKRASEIDVRIKVVEAHENLGISGNTNIALEYAKGEWIAFFDHDDLLHPCALHSMIGQVNSNPKLGLIYTDEDKITDESTLFYNPFAKPDWSPDLFRNVNYINHLTIVRAEYVRQLKGLRSNYDGAQDYDLLLRIIDRFHPEIGHVPKILYHWRAARTSTAQNISNKTYIFKAGVDALTGHLKRNSIDANVEFIKNKPGFYKINYQPKKYSILIGRVKPAKQVACARWITELLEIVGDKPEIIIGEWYKDFADNDSKAKIIYVKNDQSNYWQESARLATSDVVICFRIAALPDSAEALSELAGVAGCGFKQIVSPIITDDHDHIIDSGIVYYKGNKTNLFTDYKLGEGTYYGPTDWVRNVPDLNAHIFAMDKKILESASKDLDAVQYLNDAFKDKDNLWDKVVWVHSKFEYIGELFGGTQSSFQELKNVQLSNKAVKVYNWELDREK